MSIYLFSSSLTCDDNYQDELIYKEEDETEDEWDAKNWDDADLKLPDISSFAKEEEVAKPESKLTYAPEPKTQGG